MSDPTVAQLRAAIDDAQRDERVWLAKAAGARRNGQDDFAKLCERSAASAADRCETAKTRLRETERGDR